MPVTAADRAIIERLRTRTAAVEQRGQLALLLLTKAAR